MSLSNNIYDIVRLKNYYNDLPIDERKNKKFRVIKCPENNKLFIKDEIITFEEISTNILPNDKGKYENKIANLISIIQANLSSKKTIEKDKAITESSNNISNTIPHEHTISIANANNSTIHNHDEKNKKITTAKTLGEPSELGKEVVPEVPEVPEEAKPEEVPTAEEAKASEPRIPKKLDKKTNPDTQASNNEKIAQAINAANSSKKEKKKKSFENKLNNLLLSKAQVVAIAKESSNKKQGKKESGTSEASKLDASGASVAIAKEVSNKKKSDK